jgi:hypothetical protein
MSQVCSWCSAAVTEDATECPSCGANLLPEGDPNVPGVTAIDAAAILRSKSAPKPRGRLLSWISGEGTSDLPSKAEAQAVAPPDLEVRREILRLELEAEVANLRAEADVLWAEAAAEGRSTEGPGGPVTAGVEADGTASADVGGAEAGPPEAPPGT